MLRNIPIINGEAELENGTVTVSFECSPEFALALRYLFAPYECKSKEPEKPARKVRHIRTTGLVGAGVGALPNRAALIVHRPYSFYGNQTPARFRADLHNMQAAVLAVAAQHDGSDVTEEIK